MSGEVHLIGRLICKTPDEADRVKTTMDTHIALTRGESGCLSFEVTRTDDPLIWTVAERFANDAAFEAHQTRTASSEWARLTSGIERDFKITRMP